MCFYSYIYVLATKNVNRDKEAEAFFFLASKVNCLVNDYLVSLNGTIVSNAAHLNEQYFPRRTLFTLA